MSLSSAPPAPPSPSIEPASSTFGTRRVLGGVAAHLGDRLGLDPLWIRLAFVVLGLAAGVGLAVYAGLWLLLIAGPAMSSRLVTWLGGLIAAASVPVAISAAGGGFVDGPAAVVLLLAGIALALWQPRYAAAGNPPPAVMGVPPDQFAAAVRSTVPRRAPSPLGRATLGMATVVSAVGALIDQANGGRMHPEQWLGAGALVCGLGLVVGAFRGRGRWLVLPALAFGVAGLLGGEAARMGIGSDRIRGESIWIGPSQPGFVSSRRALLGDVSVEVNGAPTAQSTLDARSAFGAVRINVWDGVTVEVHTRTDSGVVRVDGVVRPDGTVTIGDGARPDVVVNAWTGRGDIVVTHYSQLIEPLPGDGSAVTIVPGIDGGLTNVAVMVAVTADGRFVLANGEAVIDENDRVIAGEELPQSNDISSITTSFGEFRLLSDGLLITPLGEIVDLQAVRATLSSATTFSPETEPPLDGAEPTTVVPNTTPGVLPITTTTTGA
ncbi:MAG: PspC domain-containing protein [Ilumatobacteraceae bacterium]